MKPLCTLAVTLVAAATASGAANLIPNGNLDTAAGNAPKGWQRSVGSVEELIYASDNAHSGAHFLKLDTRNVDPKLRIAWHLAEPVPLEPTAAYKLEWHFRIDSSNMKGGQAVTARGRYLGADKKPLPWRKVGAAGLTTGGWARVSHGWRFRQVEFTAPESAAFLDLDVAPGRGFKGIVAVDSLRLLKASGADVAFPKGATAFDFTPAEVKPTPGFTGVPADLAYSKQKGFGWDFRRRRRSGRPHNGNGYPERLDSTGIAGATFRCDLPNGRYLVSLYMGAVWRTEIASMNHVAVIGQRKVVDDERPYNQLMDEEYFRYVTATLVTSDDLKRPGDAVWDKYIARRYRRHDFQFEATDGQLELAIRQGYANALVIFPIRRRAAYRKALEQIDQMRRREFVETWAEFLPFPTDQTEFRPTADDRARGYVVFGRQWMRRVQYSARPQSHEVNPTLRLFATPGEYEPVTFSIWPLRDLKDVRIEADVLRNDNGDELPASAVRVWFHQHRQERRARPCTAYTINTAYLPDWGTRDLYRDITTRCWLSLRLPADTKPGLYAGAVRVKPKNGKPVTVPLRLRVLGFKLVRKPTMHTLRRAGNSVTIPYPSSYPFKPGDIRNKQFYRAQAIRDLYAHGFMPEFAAWWHGVWKKDGERLTVDWDRDNSLAGRPGEYYRMIFDLAPRKPTSLWVDACAIGHRYIMPAFEGKPTGGITIGHIEQWLDELERKAAEAGVERLYVAPWGEESHFPPGKGFETFLAFHRHVAQNRKRWPHIYTAHTCNTNWGQPPTIRDVDLAGLGMFHGASDNAEEVVEMARGSGKPYGIYGVRGRWVAGFYFWRSGAFATYHEFYAPFWGTPNNDWDNSLGMDQNARQVLNEAPGWCNVTYSPGGRMIGTWFWEEMREGVDDHDYVHTLETFVKQAAGRKGAAVQRAREQAEETLAELADAVELDVDPAQMRGLVYRPIPEEDHDGLRWKVALAAERLHAALRGQTVAPAPTPVKDKEPFLLGTPALPVAEGEAVLDVREPTVIHVREAGGPVTVDGRLDEPCYKKPPQVSHFLDHLLKKPTKARTTAHVLVHEGVLTIGVTCFESRMRRLKITETEENGNVWPDDCVEVFLDPGHTGRSYYHFGVNAGGARALVWHPYASIKLGVPKPVKKRWQVAVDRGRNRWTVEFAIPMSEFEVQEDCFGLSVCRNNPSRGELSCWTVMPKRTFHQPDAFADVYLPGARAVLRKIWLGHLAAGQNVARLWVERQSGAGPVVVALKAPDGSTRNLVVKQTGREDDVSVWEAGYTLAKKLGVYEFTARAGTVPLGRYEGRYEAAFFAASPARTYHWQGPGDPLRVTVELLVPAGASLEGLQLRGRCLADGKAIKETTLSPLPGRSFVARFGIGDLTPGTYDLELTLVGSTGEALKRVTSEFEVLPRFDVR